jgi:hypothetical protein
MENLSLNTFKDCSIESGDIWGGNTTICWTKKEDPKTQGPVMGECDITFINDDNGPEE